MDAPARTHIESESASEAPLRLELPGSLDAITPAVERVLGEMRARGRPGGPDFEVETALREALSNAVRHGCRCDPTKRVVVLVSCDPVQGTSIVVRDPGRGFDPDSIPSPLAGRNLYRAHGRGIYLIRQLMDEVSFGERGNEIRMWKR
jgi:serine/threonine-protein kinase RsbW